MAETPNTVTLTIDGREVTVPRGTTLLEAAKKVGAAVARAALEKGVTRVVFDRNGFDYHGRVAAVAQAAREAGLQF